MNFQCENFYALYTIKMVEKNNNTGENNKPDLITLIVKSLIQSQSRCGKDCACHKNKKDKHKKR